MVPLLDCCATFQRQGFFLSAARRRAATPCAPGPPSAPPPPSANWPPNPAWCGSLIVREWVSVGGTLRVRGLAEHHMKPTAMVEHASKASSVVANPAARRRRPERRRAIVLHVKKARAGIAFFFLERSPVTTLPVACCLAALPHPYPGCVLLHKYIWLCMTRATSFKLTTFPRSFNTRSPALSTQQARG